MRDVEVSVVIPAWNEEQRLGPTIRALVEELRRANRSWELVVVDDGSTDGTAGLCRRLGDEIGPRLRLLRADVNRGKGHAVRVGMLAASGAIRVMCDADGAMPARELSRLIEPVASGAAQIAIGSRYVDGARPHGQRWWRIGWSRLANALVQGSLVRGVRDIHSGYKAFCAASAKRLFGSARTDGWAFDLEILALGLRLGMTIHEVGIQWRDEPRSRVAPGRDLVRVLLEAVAIQRRIGWG